MQLPLYLLMQLLPSFVVCQTRTESFPQFFLLKLVLRLILQPFSDIPFVKLFGNRQSNNIFGFLQSIAAKKSESEEEEAPVEWSDWLVGWVVR